MVVESEPLASSLLATAEALSREGAAAERAEGAHRSVATVAHLLNSEAALLDEAIDLLCAVPAAISLPRPIHFGFLREAALIAGATAAALIALPVPANVLFPAFVGVAAVKGVRVLRADLQRTGFYDHQMELNKDNPLLAWMDRISGGGGRNDASGAEGKPRPIDPRIRPEAGQPYLRRPEA